MSISVYVSLVYYTYCLIIDMFYIGYITSTCWEIWGAIVMSRPQLRGDF